MNLIKNLQQRLGRLFELPDEVEPAARYRYLRRNLILLMLLITIVPLTIMAFINYHHYRTSLEGEILQPLGRLANKTKYSFELFLRERLSVVSFISSAYSYDQLADEAVLKKIFHSAREEIQGFVDLGLIDAQGIQINYVGPYDLKGKNYATQRWYQQVLVQGTYTSDVFMGYRQFPHIVMAVERFGETGKRWVVRATIDTSKFDEMMAAVGLGACCDAFLINLEGKLQTNTKFYGKVLEPSPFQIPPVSHQPNIIEGMDPLGRKVFIAYVYMLNPDFILMLVKPKAMVFQSWYTLKSELFFVFTGSVLIIFIIVFWLTKVMVERIRETDEKREAVFREMEHTHKLSSIGRLAAGVAHEINNPLAIINEKAGLMKDIIQASADFSQKKKFFSLVDSILRAVDRCRGITHRLLGFARRMEVQIEPLDPNEVIKEVMTFLEKEALHRNIDLKLQLDPKLPRIASDRGQLQQVFLNILNNSFAAVEDGGTVAITTWEEGLDKVAVSIQDDGHGMSEETLKHIFEPFFTTKRGYGTGLGLPITYGIIKKLGGEIEVNSKQGQGTTFTVYLPKQARIGEGGSDG